MPDKRIYDPGSDHKVRILNITCRQDARDPMPARIYVPEKAGPLPALLDVHGGAWNSGGCADNENIDLALAASGILVLAVDLRKAPAHPYPSQVQDINYAVRWLKAHAGEYGAVSHGVGALGTSSGGQGLFLSAMRPDDARYDALNLPESTVSEPDARLAYVIGAWPVIDPYARYLFAREQGRDFLVQMTDNYFPGQEAMQEGNPLMALERGEALDLPPALMMQGTADSNLPLEPARRFAQAYRNAGGTIELAWFPDMPHGFACKPGPDSDRAIEMMKVFIGRQLSGPTGE